MKLTTNEPLLAALGKAIDSRKFDRFKRLLSDHRGELHLARILNYEGGDAIVLLSGPSGVSVDSVIDVEFYQHCKKLMIEERY